MDCDLVRRALSDGDKRTLRAMKMRGHLRACAGCRDFEAALHHRPAQLAAIAPPLPLALGAMMLHGILGGAGGHGAGGGGLTAGLAAGAKAGGAFSLSAAKVATVAVIASSVAGAGVYVTPGLRSTHTKPSASTRDSARHNSRSATSVLPATRVSAHNPDAVGSPRAQAGRVASSTLQTAIHKAAIAAARTPVVVAPAGSSPASTAASTRPRPAAPAGHAPARGHTASGVRPDQVTQRPARPATSPPVAANPSVTATAVTPARVTPTAPIAVPGATAPDATTAAATAPAVVAAPAPPRPR